VTNRQKKINALLQQDLAEILHLFLRKENIQNLIVSVTAVRVTPDLQIAKVYLSVFPFAEANQILNLTFEQRGAIKNRLAERIRNQLRIVPNLLFFIDDSLQQIEKIDRSLQNPENPLKS
jgi:ribosome-binding factor A